MALCLTLRPGSIVQLGSDTFIGVTKIRGKQVRISIVSPEEIERLTDLEIEETIENNPKLSKLLPK